MDYTLHQLKVFLTVAKAKSITKAAEILHLTQPAVSIQLKNLQNQFDIPLVEIVGRQLFLTEFGKEIEEAAQVIIDQAIAIQNRTLAFKGQLAGRLNISVVSTGKYVMPYFLSGFFQQHKGLKLGLSVTNRTQVIKNLEQNEVDLSLVSLVPEHIRLEQIDLIDDKLFLIANKDFKLPKNKKAKDVFNDLPLIYREFGSGTRVLMERFVQEADTTVDMKMELASNEAVKQAILSGLGLSIMSLVGIKNELELGQLQIVPVEGLPIPATWSLVWPKGKRHSPVVEAFLDYLEEAKDTIIKEQFGWMNGL